jgi:hypothetical protein
MLHFKAPKRKIAGNCLRILLISIHWWYRAWTMQTTPPHLFSIRFILQLSIHLNRGLTIGLFPSGIPTNNLQLKHLCHYFLSTIIIYIQGNLTTCSVVYNFDYFSTYALPRFRYLSHCTTCLEKVFVEFSRLSAEPPTDSDFCGIIVYQEHLQWTEHLVTTGGRDLDCKVHAP